jgi:hypothetical protein
VRELLFASVIHAANGSLTVAVYQFLRFLRSPPSPFDLDNRTTLPDVTTLPPTVC